jgi:hypothetical protein
MPVYTVFHGFVWCGAMWLPTATVILVIILFGRATPYSRMTLESNCLPLERISRAIVTLHSFPHRAAASDEPSLLSVRQLVVVIFPARSELGFADPGPRTFLQSPSLPPAIFSDGSCLISSSQPSILLNFTCITSCCPVLLEKIVWLMPTQRDLPKCATACNLCRERKVRCKFTCVDACVFFLSSSHLHYYHLKISLTCDSRQRRQAVHELRSMLTLIKLSKSNSLQD